MHNRKASQQSFDQMLSKISARLINSDPTETRTCFDEVLAALGHYMDAARCYLFEFDRDGRRMSNTHEWVQRGISSHINELKDIPRDQLPFFFQTIQTTHRFVFSHIDELPGEAEAEREEFQREGIRAMLCMGVVINNGLLGFIGCDVTQSHREWRPEEFQRVGLVADMVANAIQRESTHRELLEVKAQLERFNRTLARQANQDGLTGISNRRALDAQMVSEMSRAKRLGTGLAVLIIDIDYFKAYNDNCGHLAGDDVLKKVASALRHCMQRSTEFLGRFGGEEFAVILSVRSRADAENTAERVLTRVHELAIPHRHSSVATNITVSIGGYFDTPGTDRNVDTDVQRFLGRADEALYRAKSEGRNCIRFAD